MAIIKLLCIGRDEYFGCGGWDRTSEILGYEPSEIPLLHSAIFGANNEICTHTYRLEVCNATVTLYPHIESFIVILRTNKSEVKPWKPCLWWSLGELNSRFAEWKSAVLPLDEATMEAENKVTSPHSARILSLAIVLVCCFCSHHWYAASTHPR